MMDFRYFQLRNESLSFFVEKEKEEAEQLHLLYDMLKANGVENTLEGRCGEIYAMTFVENKIPEGFIKYSAKESKNVVRPHKKDKKSQNWRNMLKAYEIKIHADELTFDKLKLHKSTFGSGQGSISGFKMYYTVIGRVGEYVYLEVPSKENMEINPDLKEIKQWEFVKLLEENKGKEYPKFSYVLRSVRIS